MYLLYILKSTVISVELRLYLYGMTDVVQTLIIVIPVLLISMAIHESMHGLAGLWLGDDTAQAEGRISLNPLKHVDPVLTVALPILLAVLGGPIFGAAKPVNINMLRVRYGAFGGAIIGMIGPLSNLVIAIVAAFLLRNVEALQTGFALQAMLVTITLNIGFFVFNSIPFPPLDGSRLLYAFAPEPVQRFMDMIEQQGFFAFILFMLLLYPVIGPLMSNLTSMLTTGLLS